MSEATTPPTAPTTPPEGTPPTEAQAPTTPTPPTEPTPPLEVVVDEKDAKGKVSYQETGDPGLDMALDFVGGLGFGPDHPAMQAAINGNFDLLEAELARKDGAKGYEAYMKLARKAYGDISEKTKVKQAADKAAVLEIAGSEERWEQIKTWAAKEAAPEEKTLFDGMLGKGGTEAKVAAFYLASHFDRAHGAAETEGAGPAVTAAKGSPGAGSNDALSPKEYGAAVTAARSAHKGYSPFEESAEYSKLVERRKRFKG